MGPAGVAVLLGLLAIASPVRADGPGLEGAEPLRAALSQILAAAALSGARTGVAVVSLDTGELIFAKDADELLNPASNVKLYTTAAALARLGPQYRFETEFLVEPAPGGSRVRTLYVRGKGDPTLVNERLWAIAGDLAHRGLSAVTGDLVVDDDWFDAEREGPGFDQEPGDRSYLAPAGALSLNFNTVVIHVAPGGRVGEKGRVELEPASDFFEVENRTTTVAARARRRVAASSSPAGGRQRIAVEGRLPLGGRAQTFVRKIDSPPLYFGHTLKRMLQLRGVKVAGKVRRGAVPATAQLLHLAESEPLGEVTRRLNKTSNNFMAEQVLKTLGAEARGPPGTWPKGVEATEEFLADVGIPRGSYLMKNGSGLNDANRFSARQTTTLLREMWRRFPLMAEFVAGLPVAGRDGTIRWRMEGPEAAGKVRAKTGTLESTVSLSGYVETAARQRLAFAVVVNDFPGKSAAVVRAVDAVGTALAAAGGRPADLGSAVALAISPAGGDRAAELADLEAHAAAYAKLADERDSRNLPLLRTALRTERDPVLRMVAAEAAYLSDPDSATARRTFLENVAIDSQSFGRLRAISSSPGDPRVLGSLADLAAEGNAEALSLLVEVAAAARDPAGADALADLCAEVAASAPGELVEALRVASADGADAFVTALARGLVRARDPAHPFPPAVARAEAQGSPEMAEFARVLGPRLAERTAAAEAALRVPTPAPASPLPVAPPAPPAAAAEAEGRSGGG